MINTRKSIVTDNLDAIEKTEKASNSSQDAIACG